MLLTVGVPRSLLGRTGTDRTDDKLLQEQRAVEFLREGRFDVWVCYYLL